MPGYSMRYRSSRTHRPCSSDKARFAPLTLLWRSFSCFHFTLTYDMVSLSSSRRLCWSCCINSWTQITSILPLFYDSICALSGENPTDQSPPLASSSPAPLHLPFSSLLLPCSRPPRHPSTCPSLRSPPLLRNPSTWLPPPPFPFHCKLSLSLLLSSSRNCTALFPLE